MTNARFSTLHGLPVDPLLPLDHARSAAQIARSSRAAISRGPQERRASVITEALRPCELPANVDHDERTVCVGAKGRCREGDGEEPATREA